MRMFSEKPDGTRKDLGEVSSFEEAEAKIGQLENLFVAEDLAAATDPDREPCTDPDHVHAWYEGCEIVVQLNHEQSFIYIDEGHWEPYPL